jgi:hypothetical protein
VKPAVVVEVQLALLTMLIGAAGAIGVNIVEPVPKLEILEVPMTLIATTYATMACPS